MNMNKKRTIAYIVICSMLISVISVFPVSVSAVKVGDEIGNILNTDIKTYINGNRIPSYNINNKSVVFIKDLANYGFDTVFNDKARTTTITYNPTKKITPMTNFEETTGKVGTVAFRYVYTDIAGIINGRRVECFNVKGYNAIYFSELGDFGTFAWDNARRESRFTVSTPVTGIVLDRSSLVIKAGDSIRLNATISPSSATNKTVTWSSSNTNAATVDSAGSVRGVSQGNAIITAATENGLKFTCAVTVNPAGIDVTGVSLNASTASVETGKFISLTASVTPSNATDKTLTWTSSNTGRAVVVNGYVLGIGSGTATITATAASGKYASCVVTVGAAGTEVAEVWLEKSSETVRVSDTVKLAASVIPTNAADRSLTWTSSNSNVATVDYNGNVKGISTGSVTITATANNGKYARCSVTVTSAGVAVTGITLSTNTAATVEVGKYATLTATITPSNASDKTITWSASNSRAIVSDGHVMGVSAGTVTIYATASNGIRAQYDMTITSAGTSATIPANGISLSNSSASIEAGKVFVLTATVTPSNATDRTVTWSSSSPGVATVNSSGVVQGVTVGTATITARNSNNDYRTCVITVLPVTVTPPVEEVTTISLSSSAMTMVKGESRTLNATVSPSNATITWISSAPSVAPVNAIVGDTKSVDVIGANPGQAIIIAQANGKALTYCIVTVEAPTGGGEGGGG